MATQVPGARPAQDALQLRFGFDDAAPVTVVEAAPPMDVRAPIFVRHPRARRYVLRLLPDGTPRVTIPRRGSRREAERFATSQHAWIARERARLAARRARRPAAWSDGQSILLDGERRRLAVSRGTPTSIALGADGGLSVVWPQATARDGELQRVVTAWLWRLARRELPIRLRELAAEHGLTIKDVSVRNQRTRWGSCATTGRISLNWRLVQVPAPVREYVLVHELMHLRQPNHSRRFWALVARACPGYPAARRWLREHESELLEAGTGDTLS